MPIITFCNGCGERIDNDVQGGRYQLEVPADGDMWWVSDHLTFHSRACLALWVDRTDPHGSFCPQCVPHALPPGAESPTRVSEDHYAVRFDDDRDILYTVPLIDGERADYVIELLCGEDGWAIAHDLDRPICPIHHEYLVRVAYGNVTIIDRRAEAESPSRPLSAQP